MSAKPHLKPSSHANHKSHRRSSHLKLVVNHGHRAPNKSPIVLLFAVALIASLSYAWKVGQTYFSTPPNWTASAALAPLLPAFKADGIEGYLVAKARLREQVRANLQHGSEDARRSEAEQVAVYLFPELLPETDFEKIESLELFAPRVDAIERRPRSEEAQAAFAQLRADLWNYENISRQEPQISELGAQFLNLLSALATL